MLRGDGGGPWRKDFLLDLEQRSMARQSNGRVASVAGTKAS